MEDTYPSSHTRLLNHIHKVIHKGHTQGGGRPVRINHQSYTHVAPTARTVRALPIVVAVKYGERAPRGGRLDERQLRALVPRAAVPLVRCVVGARVSIIGNPRPIRKDVTAEAGVEIRL